MMTLTNYLNDIDTKDKKRAMPSLVAVVYDNYRVIGLTSEVKSAVENYNGVDLLAKEVSHNVIASAYGNIPQTYLAYIDRDAKPASEDDTSMTTETSLNEETATDATDGE